MNDSEKFKHNANKSLVKKVSNQDRNGAPIKILEQQIRHLKRYIFGLFILLLLFGVVLIITFSVLYANLKWDLRNHDHPPKVGAQLNNILEDEELCLVCDEVRLGPSRQEDKMLDYFVRKPATADKKEQCCVETPEQLLRLLQLFVERKYREEMARGNIKVDTGSSTQPGKDRPAAHLMGYPHNKNKRTQIPGRLVEIEDWITKGDLAFTNQVMYRHGRIVILQEGLYYVYTQLSFLERFDSPPSSTTSLSTSSSLSHYLYRYNIIYSNGGEEQMIQSSFTKYSDEDKKVWEYTSFLGSVFYLREGDEIFVKVSDLTLIVWEPRQNYFGLFKVN